MSVCVTALFPRAESAFSRKEFDELATRIHPGAKGAVWRPYPPFLSPEDEFRAEGSTMMHLDGGFSLLISTQLVGLTHLDRWSEFLVGPNARAHFLSAVNTAAVFLKAGECLILPEGTKLMDAFYDGSTFQEARGSARKLWGEPDLEITRPYSIEEIETMETHRVHYCLLELPSSPKPGQSRTM